MTKRLRFLFIALTLITLSVFSAKAQNCTVNAGTNTTICPGQPFVLNGQATGLINTSASWSQIAGPSVTVSATNVVGTAATATVTGFTTDVTYGFRITAKCVDGSLVYQDVQYIVSSIQTASAGSDAYSCVGTYILQGSALNPGETGEWTKISGNGPDPASATSPNATLNFPANEGLLTGTYRWLVSKTTGTSPCTSFDDVVITGLGTQPVTAGSDIGPLTCYNVTTSTQLNGSFAATSVAYGQSALWTMVSGPSVATFNNATIRNPTVSNLRQGTYVFRYTVTGPCYSGSDEVQVTVATASQNITSAGGSTQVFCDGRSSVLLTAPKALYAGETVAWTKISGNGTQTIVSPNSNSTLITGLLGTGNYQFRYTITNASTGCNSTGNYNINFLNPPTINITTPTNPLFLNCGSTATTAVTYTVTNGTGNTQFALISAPAGSSRQTAMSGLNNYVNAIGSGNNITGLDRVGTYVFRYRRSTDNGFGGCVDAYADMTIVVSATPTAANAGTKQVLACNVFNTTLVGNVPATGTGRWSQVSGPNTATIATPSQNSTAVTGLINGTYTFRWIISGGDGACSNTQSDVQVVVAAPTPTTSVAGNAQAVCNSTPVYLEGNIPVLNEVGTWTVRKVTIGDAPEVSFSPNINTPSAVATGLLNSTAYTFTWTISNACGTSQSSVTITTSNTAGPKQATAGVSGGTTCRPNGTTSFTLAGNEPTNGESGTWTLLSGAPNTPVFTASQYNTAVTGATNGTYNFEWQLNRNGCSPTRDTVTVTISANATTAAAGADQNVCGSAVTLAGNPISVGTGSWTQTGGPGGATITNPALRNTNVTGLVSGRYTFRWTVTNNACASNFDEMIVNVSEPPTTPDAGPNQAVCDVAFTTLAANTITSGTGSWVAVSGPSIPSFVNVSDPGTNVSNLVYGTYVLRWVSRGGVFCSVLTDDVTITVTRKAEAGTDQALCNMTTATLRGNENSTGTWTVESKPGGSGAVSFTSAGTNGVLASNLETGSYVFRYTIDAVGACPATFDEMTVTITAPPSLSDAGTDKLLCLATAPTTTSVAMTATVPVSGTGTWTFVDKTADAPAATIVTPGSATTNITGLGVDPVSGVGVYLFQWTVAGTAPCNGANSNADIIRITVYKEPSTAAAGSDQLSACSNNVVMAAAPITFGIGTWSVVTQPGGSPAVQFVNLTSPTTSINGLVTGNYTFRWSVVNGDPTCTTKTDDVNVTVTTAPVTTANAGTDISLCHISYPAGTVSTALNGSIPHASETGTWSIISQPAGSALTATAFGDVNIYNTTISGLKAATGAASGTYILRWTIKNTVNQTATDCTSIDDVSITVYNTPSAAAAGATQEICLGGTLTMAATPVAVDRGIGTWSTVTNAGATPPVFSNPNSPTATVNGLVAGTYVFRWTVSNGSPTCTSTTSDVTITVRDCQIAIAKATSTPVQQSNGTYNITLTFNVQNTGNTALSGVQVTDNLLLTFPAPKSWTVTSINASGTLAANSSFNGNSNQNMLNAGSSTLAAGATATITLVLNVSLN